MRLGSRTVLLADTRGFEMPAAGVLLASMLLLAWIGGLGCSEEVSRVATPTEAPGATRSLDPRAPTNVVIISMDTTRADALGAYGQKLPTSPEIDRLAEEGVLFEQCVTSSPSTLPSHVSILTGKQPYSHGVRSNGGYVLADANVTLAEVLRSHGYATGAEIAATVISAQTQLDQGFDQYHDTAGNGTRDQKHAERSGQDITRGGIEFIRANRDRPFFLFLHYFDAHLPYVAPAEYTQRIPKSAYHAAVAHIDFQIGRVVNELRRLGLKRRTLLVLTADHGEGLDEHGENSHSYFVYDTTMRVPLIFWGPRELVNDSRPRALVRTVDIAPTILDWLGLPALVGVQGTSLASILKAEAQDLHLTGYGESIEMLTTFGGDVLRFVREGRWKYIHKLNPALYDLESDPGELHDLSDRHPDKLQALQARLRELLGAAPAAPASAVQLLDAERRAELRALGYVAADAPSGLTTDLESLELTTDPASKIEDIDRFLSARGFLDHGQTELAFDHFTALWERNPNSEPILIGLVASSSVLKRHDRVTELIERALEIAPNSSLVFRVLTGMALRTGRVEEAAKVLQHAVELDPCEAKQRSMLAELLRHQGRQAERYELLRTGVEQCPSSLEIRNDLAWMLATCRQDSLRDATRALDLATAVAADSPEENAGFLDTLAAAHAENGDFAAAASVSARALELMQGTDEVDEATLGLFRAHMAEFKAGRPIREN